jgi:hypothetical protein
MAADYKIKYGSVTTVTCSWGQLDTGTARLSQAIDNTSLLCVDAQLHLTLGFSTGGTTGNDNAVNIYFYGAMDDSHFTDDTDGTDRAYLMRNPSNLRGPFVVYFPTATGGPIVNASIGSVAYYFNGTMPKKWGFAVQNKGNVKLCATATNAAAITASYTPIYYQSV